MKKTQRKTKSEIIDELRNKLILSSADDISSSFYAHLELDKCMNIKGGGVLMEIKSLSGASIVRPVLIHNGLSAESIAALKADLIKTNLYKQDFCFEGDE